MDNPRPRDSPIRGASFVFTVVVVLGVAMMGVVNLIEPVPATSPSQMSPRPCSRAYPSVASNRTVLPNGTEITRISYPAPVVNAGSALTLCVEYSGGAYSGPAYHSAYLWEQDGQFRPALGANITASPAGLYLTQGETVDVQYTFSASPNSTGFYGLSLLQVCIPVPVAVGYRPSQVGAADFPGLFGVRFCPAQLVEARIVGYTGATVADLTEESRFNPTLNITDISVSSFPASEGAENVTFRMELHTFSHSATVGPSLNGSVVRVFSANPGLTTLPVNGSCSWYPSNTEEVNRMNITTFQRLPAGYVRVSAATLQLGAYSTTYYTFSMLFSGHMARFTAIDPSIYAKRAGQSSELFAIAAYFPVSVAGQLQTESGPCLGYSAG